MNYKILMVDDDRELLKMLNQYFTLKNYTVMIAENALFLYLISEKMQKSNVTSFLRVALKKTRNKSIVLMLFTTW